jgi:ApaG protein
MRKHCFQYTVRITNDSPVDTVQLLSRRFEIQTVGSSMKDVVQGEGVTGRQPILKPGEVFEYTSTAPLSVRPIGTTSIAARMCGEYQYCVLGSGQDKATDEQVNKGQGEAGAELATFHFVFPEAQRVKPARPSDDDDDDDDDDDSTSVKTTTVASSTAPSSPPASARDAAAATPTSTPASSLPGEPDMTSGNISASNPNDSSDTLSSDVRVVVTSTYRPERSDPKLDKHCFAYNVRITNESRNDRSIQLVSRRFEIQTVGSANKDVVQGPGVTGRQPVLKPGESFEYTSTAPLSVRPMLDRTKVVARMSGEYNFVQLADDGKTPLSSTPLKAELGAFHFILPA